MDIKFKNRLIALAAIAQAASLVNELARFGNCNQSSFTTSIKSIFTLNVQHIDEIYGPSKNLNEGLGTLEKLYGEPKKIDPHLPRYFIGICQVAKRLRQDTAMQKIIQQGIEKAHRQAEYFNDSAHSTVVASLADLYVNTFGNFNYRIMILGDKHYMTQTDILAKIRCVLLAGIRAAILWHQLGGRRWQLVLQRKKIQAAIQTLRD